MLRRQKIHFRLLNLNYYFFPFHQIVWAERKNAARFISKLKIHRQNVVLATKRSICEHNLFRSKAYNVQIIFLHSFIHSKLRYFCSVLFLFSFFGRLFKHDIVERNIWASADTLIPSSSLYHFIFIQIFTREIRNKKCVVITRWKYYKRLNDAKEQINSPAEINIVWITAETAAMQMERETESTSERHVCAGKHM